MDQEDMNFLKDIGKELLKINPIYKAEAEELENIIHRETHDKIRFICTKCGEESWFTVDLDTYIITALDLMCDDCNPVEE